MTNHVLVRDAHVEVTAVRTRGRNKIQHSADIVINGEYSHSFPTTSRVSKALELMEPQDLAERLSGGSFFFVADEDDHHTLVDFRDGSYNGFVHEDQNISKFMEVIGFTPASELPLHQRRKNAEDKILLRSKWSDGAIEVPGFADGGQFSSELSFKWSPFEKTINSTLDLIRLICSNGMVAKTSFLNTKIPLFNRWEEHLDIASRQIQNKVNGIVRERMAGMALARASVNDCLLLETHITNRLYAPTAFTGGERDSLLNMLAAVSPAAHLGEYYKSAVFASPSLASQLPAHLTQMDVWNVATELRTHTRENAESSSHALDRFANQLLFDNDDNMTASVSRFSGPRQSAFSDPEKAFFGVVH